MPIRKRGAYYQIDIQVAGVRVREKVRTSQEAKEREAFIKNRLHQDNHASKLGRAPKRTLSEAIIRWLDNDCKLLKSSHKFESHVRNMQPYIKGIWLTDSLEALEQMSQAMLAENLSTATVNRRLAIARRILNLCYTKWKWLDVPIGDKVKMLPENCHRHIYLTHEQVEDLAKKCPDPVAGLAVRVAAYTGLRRSELLGLEGHNIRDNSIILDTKTKSGRPRVIPLPPDIWDIELPLNIEDYPLRKSWDAARTEAKLTHVRFHDLRHTYASWLIQSGAPLTAVRDLMGHANLAVTDRYAHLATGHLEAAVNLISKKKG